MRHLEALAQQADESSHEDIRSALHRTYTHNTHIMHIALRTCARHDLHVAHVHALDYTSCDSQGIGKYVP